MASAVVTAPSDAASPPRRYTCPVCLKVLSRSDSLRRHVATHEQEQEDGDEDGSPGSPSRPAVRVSTACDACSKLRLRCSRHTPCTRCRANGVLCETVREIRKRGRRPKAKLGNAPTMGESPALGASQEETSPDDGRSQTDRASSLDLSAWITLPPTIGPEDPTMMQVNQIADAWASWGPQQSIPLDLPPNFWLHNSLLDSSMILPPAIIQPSLSSYALAQLARDAGVELDELPGAHNIAEFCRLFVEHAQEWLPVISATHFDPSREPWEMVLAIAAFGARYSLAPTSQAESLALAALCRSSWARTGPTQAASTASLVAQFLCLFVEAFGDTASLHDLHRTSHSSLIANVRQLKILELAAEPALQASPGTVSLHECWQKWRDYETRKRVGLFCFVFDSYQTLMYQLPPSMRLSELNCSLPCPDSLWECSTAEAWAVMRLSSPSAEISVLDAVRDIIGGEVIPESDTMQRFVLLTVLARYLHERRESRRLDSRLFKRAPPIHLDVDDQETAQVQRALDRAYEHFGSRANGAVNPGAVREILLRHFFAIRQALPLQALHEVASSQLATVFRSSEEPTAIPGHAKAGDLFRWAKQNPVALNSAVAHAIEVCKVVRRLPALSPLGTSVATIAAIVLAFYCDSTTPAPLAFLDQPFGADDGAAWDLSALGGSGPEQSSVAWLQLVRQEGADFGLTQADAKGQLLDTLQSAIDHSPAWGKLRGVSRLLGRLRTQRLAHEFLEEV